MERILLVDPISMVSYTNILSEGITPNSNNSIIIQGPIQKANTLNGNGRVYPEEILRREIDKYIKERVNIGGALGELDHPESSVVELKNVSHRVVDIWWEGLTVMGKIEIIDEHPSGRIIKALLEKKIPIGISSRGMGSVRQIGEAIQVGSDFELLCFDLVSTPSTAGAYLFPVESTTATDTSKLQESLNKQILSGVKYSKVNELITEILSNK